MVRKSRKRHAPDAPPEPIRWGWVYVWLLLVFAGILLATTQSVERKGLAMSLDGLIEKKLSLLNTLAELQVKYQEKQTFSAMSRMVDELHLELGPSAIPPVRLGAADRVWEATP
ncbi:hypothetical protein HS125_15970 [bacterium]|nr:hypothetical protein [bacterium]